MLAVSSKRLIKKVESPLSVGFAQLSEREMIQKALAESAMDFVKRSDRTKGSQEDKYGTTDEEYDSPSP